MEKFYIFDTHPIQYRVPVFRALFKRFPGLEVFYFNRQFEGKKWWFSEVGKSPKHQWALDLDSGFKNSVLDHRSLRGFFVKLFKLLKTHQPQAVLIYGWYLPEHWVVWFCCWYLNIPLIFVGETFALGSSPIRRAIKKVLHPLFFSAVSQVVAIGDKTEQFYKMLHIKRNRIVCAKYCVDTNFFTMEESRRLSQKIAWRHKWQIAQDAFVILFVGRLFDRKRPFDVIKLHEQLSTNLNIYTVIVGTGELEQSLKEHAPKRVIFTGFQSQSEIKEAYFAADVLFVPSEFETWGLVINEAFSCGLPAIVSDTCGAAEDLVQNEKTGFVFPLGNLKEASTQMQRLIDDPQKREEMGRAARKRVLNSYRVDQFAEALLRAFRNSAVLETR